MKEGLKTRHTVPPTAVPAGAIFLRGLRIPAHDRCCYLEYSDRAGNLRDRRISFAAAGRLLKWMSRKRLSFPIQVRRQVDVGRGTRLPCADALHDVTVGGETHSPRKVA